MNRYRVKFQNASGDTHENLHKSPLALAEFREHIKFCLEDGGWARLIDVQPATVRPTPHDRWWKVLATLEAKYQVEVLQDWNGTGSAYAMVRDGEGNTLKLRISDHAQTPGGGLRWSEAFQGFEPAGDADISIHPGSSVTLRNLLPKVAEAIQKVKAEEA